MPTGRRVKLIVLRVLSRPTCYGVDKSNGLRERRNAQPTNPGTSILLFMKAARDYLISQVISAHHPGTRPLVTKDSAPTAATIKNYNSKSIKISSPVRHQQVRSPRLLPSLYKWQSQVCSRSKRLSVPSLRDKLIRSITESLT